MLLRLLINSLTVLIVASLLPGVQVDSYLTALLVSVVLGIVNILLKPLLILLTLPLTILTLGLFTFVINALLILLVSSIVPGFHVNGFIQALLFSLIMSLVSSLLQSLTK